jgi:hypothetical protein
MNSHIVCHNCYPRTTKHQQTYNKIIREGIIIQLTRALGRTLPRKKSNKKGEKINPKKDDICG